VVIEVFPSWDVEESQFDYFGGEQTSNEGVSIEMRTDREKGEVTVSHGALGVPAMLVVYGKEVKRVSLEDKAGSVSVSGVESLFTSGN
jgi:hypothetical protein